jgi:hypothetical protein
VCLLACACADPVAVFDRSCTAIGCADAVSIALRGQNGTWRSGSYAIQFDADELSYACTLTIPADFPQPSGNATGLACDHGMTADFRAATTCSEQRTAATVNQTCDVVENQWLIEASVPGTPRALHVAVQREGSSLLEHSETVRYSETRPNGPDCEPVCQQSRIELGLDLI